MKRIATILLLGLATVILAQDRPETSDSNGPLQSVHNRQERIRRRNAKANVSVSKALQLMDQSERKNAIIDLELSTAVTPETEVLADEIEDLWNAGNFTAAIDRLPDLNTLTHNQYAIGISWREPIPAENNNPGLANVPIGNRTKVELVTLDIHRASGNQFSVLQFWDDPYDKWTVNISTDGGTSWSETFDWIAEADWGIFIDMCVVGNNCYVGYNQNNSVNSVRLRQFKTSDGTVEQFGGSNYSVVVDLPNNVGIIETGLCSNQEYYNNRLYYSFITSDGDLMWYVFYDDDKEWHGTGDTGITNADYGLDVCCNEGFNSSGNSGRFFYACYIDTDYNACVTCYSSSDNFPVIYTHAVGGWPWMNSIGAWDDYVFFAHEKAATTVPGKLTGTTIDGSIRYVKNETGGDGSWYYGFAPPGETYQTEGPDVALKEGHGLGFAYNYYNTTYPGTASYEGWFQYRNYEPPWSPGTMYSDHEPYFWKPAVEVMNDGTYALVYSRDADGRAYYQKNLPSTSDIDLDDIEWLPAEYILEQNYPNPFNPTTEIAYNIPETGHVTIEIFNHLGQKVATLVNEHQSEGYKTVQWNAGSFASGIYYCRLQAKDTVKIQKMVYLK